MMSHSPVGGCSNLEFAEQLADRFKEAGLVGGVLLASEKIKDEIFYFMLGSRVVVDERMDSWNDEIPVGDEQEPDEEEDEPFFLVFRSRARYNNPIVMMVSGDEGELLAVTAELNSHFMLIGTYVSVSVYTRSQWQALNKALAIKVTV